jgi:hypothetical protein
MLAMGRKQAVVYAGVVKGNVGNHAFRYEDGREWMAKTCSQQIGEFIGAGRLGVRHFVTISISRNTFRVPPCCNNFSIVK